MKSHKGYRDYLVRGTIAVALVLGAMTGSFGLSSTTDVGVAQASTGLQTAMSMTSPKASPMAAPTPTPYAGTASGELTGEAKAPQPPQHCITSGIGSAQAIQCFNTEAEALRVASGGRIQLEPGQTARSLPYEEVFGSSANPDNPSSIQAILYEHANYGGATLTIYNSGCYIWNNMPGGWNDVTSSVWSGPCGVTLYDYPNNDLSGKWACIGPPGTSYVGDAMNDRASSWSIP
ncbi:MAG: hypothetical protein IVW55_09755 [Chloroflexi bacterium]|nr:hypothetical protein [Chloroflexota bacterium]